MCAFCAAIPASLAVGANFKARELREQREIEQRGEPLPKRRSIPIGTITIVVTGVLVVSSVVYHSQFSG